MNAHGDAFQRKQYGKEERKSKFTMEKADKCYLSQMIEINIQSKSYGDSTLDMLKRKWHSVSKVFLPNHVTPDSS